MARATSNSLSAQCSHLRHEQFNRRRTLLLVLRAEHCTRLDSFEVSCAGKVRLWMFEMKESLHFSAASVHFSSIVATIAALSLHRLCSAWTLHEYVNRDIEHERLLNLFKEQWVFWQFSLQKCYFYSIEYPLLLFVLLAVTMYLCLYHSLMQTTTTEKTPYHLFGSMCISVLLVVYRLFEWGTVEAGDRSVGCAVFWIVWPTLIAILSMLSENVYT